MSLTCITADYLETCDLHQVRKHIVADGLGYSLYTYIRLLKSEGTTYAKLLFDERKRRCQVLLRINPHSSCELIARKCGYSEASSAGRSFQTWFGVSLRAYKNRESK